MKSVMTSTTAKSLDLSALEKCRDAVLRYRGTWIPKELVCARNLESDFIASVKQDARPVEFDQLCGLKLFFNDFLPDDHMAFMDDKGQVIKMVKLERT